MACSRLDLPEPVGPVTRVRVPGSRSRSTPSRMLVPAKPSAASRSTTGRSQFGSRRPCAANPRTSIEAASASARSTVCSNTGTSSDAAPRSPRSSRATRTRADGVQQGGEGRPRDDDRARDGAQRPANRAAREQAAHVDDDVEQAEGEDDRREGQRAHQRRGETAEGDRPEQGDVLERTCERDARQVEQPELAARGAAEEHPVGDPQRHERGREDRCRSQGREAAAVHQLPGGVDSVPVV